MRLEFLDEKLIELQGSMEFKFTQLREYTIRILQGPPTTFFLENALKNY